MAPSCLNTSFTSGPAYERTNPKSVIFMVFLKFLYTELAFKNWVRFFHTLNGAIVFGMCELVRAHFQIGGIKDFFFLF